MNNIEFNKVKNINFDHKFYSYYDHKNRLIKKKFEIGDHIKYDFFKNELLKSERYQNFLSKINFPKHHCVYIGNGKIMDYTKYKLSDNLNSINNFIKSFSNFKTEIEDLNILNNVLNKIPIYVGKYPNIDKKQIIKRVKGLKNNNSKYSIFYNNCETTAIYCITGEKILFNNELNSFLGNTIMNISKNLRNNIFSS